MVLYSTGDAPLGLDTFQLKPSDDQAVLILRIRCSLWTGNLYFFFIYTKAKGECMAVGKSSCLAWFCILMSVHLPVIQVRLFFIYSFFHFPGYYFFMLCIKTWPVLCPCRHDDMQHLASSCECNRRKLEAILRLQSLGIQLQVLHWSLGLASTARYTAVSVCRDFTLLLVFLYFAFLMFFYIQSSVWGKTQIQHRTNLSASNTVTWKYPSKCKNQNKF